MIPCRCAGMRVCLHAGMPTCVYVCVHKQVSAHVHVGISYACQCLHACTHAYMHARTHTCTHARTHACMHARTHACVQNKIMAHESCHPALVTNSHRQTERPGSNGGLELTTVFGAYVRLRRFETCSVVSCHAWHDYCVSARRGIAKV